MLLLVRPYILKQSGLRRGGMYFFSFLQPLGKKALREGKKYMARRSWHLSFSFSPERIYFGGGGPRIGS